MSKKTRYLLGILLAIVVGTYFYWKICCRTCAGENTSNDNTLMESSTEAYKKGEPTFIPFTVNDSRGDLSLQTAKSFNFKESDLRILSPVSKDLESEIVKLKDYLTTNEGKSLAITGNFKSDEQNNSAFPNLGVARANAVKNYLVSKGIPSKLIDTYGKKNDEMVADKSKIYHGPVTFEVVKLKDNTKAMKTIADDIKVNPLVVYFKQGSATVNLTPEQRKKIVAISTYLDKVDGSSCLVVGHTDNTGKAANNIKLGQSRANVAKEYLKRNAIPQNKIITLSKGQTEPIADNATEEGRAKNRRIVITIK